MAKSDGSAVCFQPMKVTTESDEESIAEFGSALKSALPWNDCNYGPVRMLDTVTHRLMGDRDYGSQWTELDFQVATDDWQKCFLPFAARFQEIAARIKSIDVKNVILQVSHKQLFSADCISAHLFLPLDAIHFGSFIQGKFTSHFSRKADVGSSHDQIQSFTVLKAFRNEDARITSMFVDFEQDRGLFVVRFAILDGGFKSKNIESGEGQNDANFTSLPGSAIALKVKYTSIRRIVVDLKTNAGNFRRLYFQLNCPPEIRKCQKYFVNNTDKTKSEGNRWRTFPEYNGDKRDNCASINESPYFCLDLSRKLENCTLYELLSRLRARTSLPIEFCNVSFKYFNINNYVNPPVRLIGCDHRACASGELFGVRTYKPPTAAVDAHCQLKIQNCNSFSLEYLIAALLSRGADIKDQILINSQVRDQFIEMIIRRFNENEDFSLESLERLINLVDESKQVPCVFTAFENIYNGLFGQGHILKQICRENQRDGYQRVRKVVVTPTRTLLVVPELLMGNRVLRTFDKCGDCSLRVQFRDDDGTQLRRNTVGPSLIQSTTFNTLTNGIHIGGVNFHLDRHFVYLGSSNSQMRDNGCYFYDDGPGGQVRKIREQLGRFDSCDIPKMMSRIGQCFTQAKRCAVILRRCKYNKTYDIIGGKDPSNNPYIFSDGVGKVSQTFACKIATDIGLGSSVPSCFQIRHRGIKGVLSVDLLLDERKKWTQENCVIDCNNYKNKQNDLAILFRPSQDKFKAPRNEFIEIVKYSTPTQVCLNRPMICILDQVSDMQGYALHKRITERIKELLGIQLGQMTDTLMNEHKSRERLNEFPWRFDVFKLSLSRGFALTQEPFFRSLLKASVKFTLRKQLAKEQIQIPVHMGRSMFGVVDETGQLQYGQVFIQYTKNVFNKSPTECTKKIILTGRVMITKNPCIVAGDIRVFQAVDIPELRHLVDVVVFPQHGPRSHPDEMAGSDLDGDEYSVIWDSDLMFSYNEPASDFTKVVGPQKELADVEEVDFEMRKFFVDYIKQDSIGSIANAFLVNADLYGLKSEICENIAKKHSQAVDFPKTGQPPTPLTKNWSVGKHNKPLPPERAERWPDFMCKSHEPSYISPRIVGKLFRRIRLLDDVLSVLSATEQVLPVTVDPTLIYPNWESYKELAIREMNSYNAYIRAILENYGIEDEGQLFSSCFSTIRNRISDRDMDDMSFYNTNHVIERKVSALFQIFRCSFFEEFGGFVGNTVVDKDEVSNDPNRRFCHSSSVKMREKASAYYVVCYKAASENCSKRILSFGWLAWDILCHVKLEMRQTLSSIQYLDPLADSTTEFIYEFCTSNTHDMAEIFKELEADKAFYTINLYCQHYKDLDKLLYIIVKWAHYHNLLNDHVKNFHICLLFIQFGLGFFEEDGLNLHIQFLEKKSEPDSCETVYLNNLFGGIGTYLLKFLNFASSSNFQKLKTFNFRNFGYHSLLLRGQFTALHKVAIKTFFCVALNGKFDHIALFGAHGAVEKLPNNDLLGLTEIEPFMIELPYTSAKHDEQFVDKIKKHSGAKYVRMRRVVQYRKDRAIVSAVGTLDSLHKLRDLLSVRPSVNSFANSKECNDMIGRYVLERLENLE